MNLIHRLKNQLFKYYFPETVVSAAIGKLPSKAGIVLMYHEVLPDAVNFPVWTIVRENDFRWQMEYISTHFEVLSMDQALERVCGKVKGDKPFAVVTFDDGYLGNIEVVLPIMESLKLPFTVYVATRAVFECGIDWYNQVMNLCTVSENIELQLEIDGKTKNYNLNSTASDRSRWAEMQRLLTALKQLPPQERDNWVEQNTARFESTGFPLRMLTPTSLKALAASKYVTIGSHTHRHELLDQIKPNAVQETLKTSHDLITEMAGQAPKHFAYPNGNFTSSLFPLIREAGYDSAVTTFCDFWTQGINRLQIPRIPVGRFNSRYQFKALVSGFLHGSRKNNNFPSSIEEETVVCPVLRAEKNNRLNNPVNILYIIDSLSHGGTERQLVQLIKNLDTSRFRPHLCTLKPSFGLYDELDIPKVSLDLNRFSSPAFVKKIMNLHHFIKDNHIQLVQTFFQDPFLLAALIKPFNQVKLIGSFRDLGFWRKKSETLKMRIAYPFFSGFIANSLAVKDHFIGTDRINSEKIEVIHNCFDMKHVDENLFTDGQEKKPVVGIVGNFNRRVKRTDDFVRAAALVSLQRPDVNFVIVGEGYLRKELEALAMELGIFDKIEFTGNVSDPIRYVRNFSVGVITSESEGFCNAIIEYMACGIPVVATDTGGNPELIEEGENGFLVPVNRPDALAEKILWLLNNDQRRLKFSNANREKISTNYSVVKMIDRHSVFYEKVLAG